MRNRYIPDIILGAGIAIAVFAMGFLFASVPPTPQQEQQRSTTENTERGGTEGAVGKISDANDRIADYTYWLTWLTFVTALASGGLWYLTGRTLKHSRETSERQLRAYIGVINMDVTVYPLEGAEFAFIARIEMKNFGQTPANDMSIWAEAVIAGPDAKPFDMTREPKRPAGGSIAFPTASLNVDKGWAISSADKEALFKREKFVFLWGSVRYTDLFGTDRYFRYRMQSTGQIAIGTTGTYAVAPLAYESN